MKKIVVTILFAGMMPAAFSQAPGNVLRGGLELWLKPSSFTASTWTDLSTKANDFTQATANKKAQIASLYVNYNSVVEFDDGDGQRDYMNGGLVLANGKTKFSVFTMAYPKSTNGNYSPIIEFEQTNGTRFEVQGANRNGFAGIDMPVLDAKSPLPRGTPNPRAQIGSMVANTTNLVIGLDGTDSTALATPVTTVSGAAARVGTSNRGPLRAYIGDIIVYGVTVSSIQRRKIETYLAVKYGVTLANNYVDTAGTTIYTVSSNNKKIIGLGRDSKSDLLQKQSQTPDDSARIYLSTLVATNSANIGTITNDVSYVVMGGDAGKMNATGASVAEMSSGLGLHSRLEREWKITKTNFVDVINIDLKLSAAARPGSVDVSHLRLLIDDDGNFGNGGTTSYANGDGSGIVISYSNPTITISNITSTQIANNSTKYFTIGTTNSATPLPIELTYFNAAPINRMVQLKWQTASERNNDYYTVECSANGTDWKTVGSISAAGNSTSELNYTLYDEEPTIGVSYYRLKQTDFNGSFSVSPIQTVTIGKLTTPQLTIYPNPTTNQLTLEGDHDELEDIQIYNLLKQDVSRFVQTTSISKSKLVIDLSNLPEGVYYVKTKNTTNKVQKQ